MGNQNRHPIRIAFPAFVSDFDVSLIIFLFCGEIESQTQKIIEHYQKENPGLESMVLIQEGSSFCLLESFRSGISQKLLKDIRELSSGKPFSLIIINHENCSGIDYSEGEFPAEDFFQFLDMREKLPELLHEIKNLSHLSLYAVERAGKPLSERHKIRHLGDFF